MLPAWSELASDVMLRLVGAPDDELDAVVNEALGEIATACAAERGYITFYDPSRQTFDISHEWTHGVVPHRPAIQDVELRHFPWSVGYAERQEVLVVHDIDDLPPEAAAERASFGAFGVRGIIQAPIVINGATVGLTGLNRFRPDEPWDPALVEFVSRVGQALGVALVRQRASRDVAAARARADEALRQREELLAHVSHELRTPLHAILGYAELLELDARSDDDRDALMRIQTNGRHLLGMIDDLANLARGDGAAPAIDVASVVAELITDLHPIADDRGLDLVAGAASGFATWVEVGRYRQIARCMVIGAAQSMRDGRIVVEGSVGDDGAPEIRLRLASTHAITRDGLVLPIAQALVAGHGRIDVSAPDDRTTATVRARFDAASAGE